MGQSVPAERDPSKQAVTEAGELIRRHDLKGDVDPFALGRAMDVLAAWRAGWVLGQQPLQKVNMGLRSMIDSVVPGTAPPTQRLKRLPRIVEKFVRDEHPSMRLAQMEDIGGCRVVLQSLGELQRLRERISERWSEDVRKVRDYVLKPKADGYRAIHVIVERHDRLVEVQLRTKSQNAWATLVERLEGSRGEMLRAGRGDPDLQSTLRFLSHVMALEDMGEEVPSAIRSRVRTWLALVEESE